MHCRHLLLRARHLGGEQDLPTKYLACVKACDQNCPHMAGEDPIRTYIA